MPERIMPESSSLPRFRPTLAVGLSSVLKEGYQTADLRSDLMAGLIVGIVALPLSMALAIASGVPPQHGLYTAIVAGGLIALLGGSRVQVSGPTAAFVVILAPVSAKFGISGLLLASMLAGLLLILAGVAGVGRLIEFIPYPVTTGFTSGIAVVIATLQIRDFLGLSLAQMPEHYLGKVGAIFAALPTAQPADIAIGAMTLFLLIWFPRMTRVVPAPLVALAAGGVAAALLARLAPGWNATTIASRFSFVLDGVRHSGIPSLPPLPGWPWNQAGPNGASLALDWQAVESLIGPAFAIAVLGAIESLLSAVVADGMTGGKHDPDCELIAQGIGNVVAPFFGGFAATGAIARTATNIRCGARSPLAAFSHALFVLCAVMLLAPIMGYLPMASMAALLFIVAWNMSEARHFVHLLRVAPGSDVFVLLACFGLTVVFDMVIAVSAGVVLAALLFMGRMAELSSVKLVDSHALPADQKIPPHTLVYEIAGPLFFGAAQKAMSSLRTVAHGIRTVILDLRSVPVMDATGLVNLESVVERLRKSGVFVILTGVQKQPLHVIARGGWKNHHLWMAIHGSMEEALDTARQRATSLPIASA